MVVPLQTIYGDKGDFMRLIIGIIAALLFVLPAMLLANEPAISPAVGRMSVTNSSAATAPSVLSYDRTAQVISLAIPRDQSVTFMAYFVNGQRIGEFNRTRFMRKGVYTIKMDMLKLPRGVLIFKAKGEDFAESKTIRLIDNNAQ